MTTREDEIRARLAAATPGPWDANERDIVFFARNHGPAHGLTLGAVQGYVSAEEQQANLQFIAHAPEDIAYLLGEVERLKQQVEDRDKAAKSVIISRPAWVDDVGQAT